MECFLLLPKRLGPQYNIQRWGFGEGIGAQGL
jgi:hypothetical protein